MLTKECGYSFKYFFNIFLSYAVYLVECRYSVFQALVYWLVDILPEYPYKHHEMQIVNRRANSRRDGAIGCEKRYYIMGVRKEGVGEKHV